MSAIIGDPKCGKTMVVDFYTALCLDPDKFEGLLRRVVEFLNQKNSTLYVQDVFAGTDPSYSVPGRSLLYFAPNFAGNPSPVVNGQTEHGSVYQWDVNHQLFKLTGPLADAAALCSDANVPRITGEDYITARDRCMMARAQTDTVCWSGDEAMTIAPAHGPDVARAVNTIFDIWMGGFLV